MKKDSIKKRFVVIAMFVSFFIVSSFNSYAQVLNKNQAVQNVMQSINENSLPDAVDLLTVADKVNSTKISFTPISQKTKTLLDRLNLNGLSVVSEKKSPVLCSSGELCKEYELSVFQFEKDGVFISPEDIKPLLYNSPHEFSGGYSEYNVYGTIKVTIQEHPTQLAWKISSVSASTVAGTQTVKASQIHIRAINSDPYDFDEQKDKYVNNPTNNRFYTLYPNFRNFNSLGGYADLKAAARFALTNGHSFTLMLKVRGEDFNPFDEWVFYDVEMGNEG